MGIRRGLLHATAWRSFRRQGRPPTPLQPDLQPHRAGNSGYDGNAAVEIAALARDTPTRVNAAKPRTGRRRQQQARRAALSRGQRQAPLNRGREGRRASGEAGTKAGDDECHRTDAVPGLSLEALLDCPERLAEIGRLDQNEVLGINPEDAQAQAIRAATLERIADRLHPDEHAGMQTHPLPANRERKAYGRGRISQLLRLDLVHAVRMQAARGQQLIDLGDTERPVPRIKSVRHVGFRR